MESQSHHDPGSTTPPLSQIICCKLCFSVYTSPKLLPCLHSFCCSCLSAHCDSQVSKHRPTVCPSCSEPFDVPNQGIASLPNNVVLQRAILANVNQIQLKSPMHCRNRDRSGTQPNKFSFSDQFPPVASINKYLPNNDLQDTCTTSDETLQRHPSRNTDQGLCEQTKERDPMLYVCRDLAHTSDGLTRQSTSESVQNDEKCQTPDQSTLESPNMEPDLFTFQQEHRMMVKSCSEFSNFSIGSLKFEPPSDYADIAEDAYKEDDKVFNSSAIPDPIMEEQRQRDRIKDELAGFQTEALGIVYSIDNLNKEKDRWNKHKQNLQDRIQQRSARLQDLIKSFERRLLLQVEAHWQDINRMEVIEKYKSYMHNRLKGILAMTDLARMILDHGLSDELPIFEEMISNRKQKINGEILSFEKPYVKFVIPADEEVTREKLFGSLNVVKKSESFWEFCPAAKIVSTQTGTDEQNKRSVSEPVSSEVSSEAETHIISQATDKGKPTCSPMACRSPSIEKLKTERFSSTRRSRSSSARRSFSRSDSSRSRRQSVESPNAEEFTFSSVTSHPTQYARTPSSITCKTNNGGGFAVTNIPVTSPPHTPVRNINSDNRRYTEGNVEIDWERDFLNTTESEEVQYSDSNRAHSVINDSGRLRHLNDDVQQTRRMLAMCKKQLLEAQTESNPLLNFPTKDVQSGSLPSSPRERFDYMKLSARRKSYKWRSESRDSISSFDGD